MVTLVARKTVQLTVVQLPAVMLEGLAEKATTEGGEPLGALDSTGKGDDPVSSPSPGGQTSSEADIESSRCDGTVGGFIGS